jgi:hypothetical protein
MDFPLSGSKVSHLKTSSFHHGNAFNFRIGRLDHHKIIMEVAEDMAP